MSLILHDIDFDEDSYKVRLLLGLLGLEYRSLREEEAAGAAPGAEANLPCLVDGDTVVHEAEAILAYFARRHDWRERWLPADDPRLFGQTMTWLAFAGRKLRAVGLVDPLFGLAPDDPDARDSACRAFRRLDDHLTARQLAGCIWCVGRTATIADVAVFPAAALSERAGFDLAPYQAIGRWMEAFRALPGFVEGPAMPDQARVAPLPRPPRPALQPRGNVVAMPAAWARAGGTAKREVLPP